jgi:hypothetical protein
VAGPSAKGVSGELYALAIERSTPPWAEHIIRYLQDKVVPDDDTQAERIARQAKMNVLIDGDLYMRWECGVKLRCIPQEEGRALLEDIHGGMCSSHVASRALAGKAFRQGFYWPTAQSDAEDLVQTCEACQFHAKNINQPA